jgi:hypothetical protein
MLVLEKIDQFQRREVLGRVSVSLYKISNFKEANKKLIVGC